MTKKREMKDKKINETESSSGESEDDIENAKNKKKNDKKIVDENKERKKTKKTKTGKELKDETESSESEMDKDEKKTNKQKKKSENNSGNNKEDLQHQQKLSLPKKEEIKKKNDEEDEEETKRQKKEMTVKSRKNPTLTEKEKTKDVEEFVGSTSKKQDDGVKDEALLDETGKKNSDDSERMLTVKDLVEMMSIMMVSQRRLGNPNMVNIGDISSIDISTPAICDEISPEFELKHDSLAKWCVFQGRIRTIEPFVDYESFIKNYISMLHEVVSEFHRYFRISDRINLQSIRIIPPEIVGSYSKWSEIQKSDVIQSYYNHIDLFRPHKLNNGYTHRIFLNPCLQAFCDSTQRFLCQGDPGYEIRLWVDRFVQKKQNKILIGMNPVFGTTSSFWLRCSSPRILPTLLSALPNSNYISVMYGSQFSYPEMRLSVVDISSLSAALSLTMSSDGMNTIVSASPGAANFDDFQRIVLSMLFPVQVQINIIYSVTAPPGVDACAAICAKLLMSSSLLSRNVTKNAAYQTDLVLSEWLVRLGYQRASTEAPLQLTYSPRGNQAAIRDSVWSNVASVENESTGWLNFNCDDFRVIENPLYDRVNRVPQYGGVTAYFDSTNYGDSMTIPVPPIWLAIMRGLNELAGLNTKVSMQMMGFFQQLRVKYLEYLAKLNRYISIYVESGFRLTDDILNILAINDPIGQLDENANNPELVNITSDSLFKFFKQLPNEFDPPQRIVKQPIIESVISQEVQRIISLFQTISARVEHDRRTPTVKPKYILKMVVESAKVSPLVRSIFESAYRGYDVSRQDIRVFNELHAMRDDFFASFYPEMNAVVIGSPEAFGLVEDIIRVRRSIDRLTPAETEARSHTGINMKWPRCLSEYSY